MEMPSSLMVRNGTSYVHVRVPSSIVASVDKRFITKSLRTKDPKAARRKLHDEVSEINQDFDRHRARATQQPQPTIRPVLSFAETARQYARDVSDKEFADRAAHRRSIGTSLAAARLGSSGLVREVLGSLDHCLFG